MCRCTPNIRTPFCGKQGCELPKQEEPKEIILIMNEQTEYYIKDTKKLRVELDAILQGIKASDRKSIERSISITKLQEAIMWLGMDLKDLGTPTPYPNSYNPSNAIVEPTADGLKL